MKNLKTKNNSWRVFSFFIGILACFSLAQANGIKQADELTPFIEKCDSLKTDPKITNKETFVIWDAETDHLYPCSKSNRKKRKLTEAFENLTEDQRDGFLSFRRDGRIHNLNTSLFWTFAKVKKEEHLNSLKSKAYDSLVDSSKIIGPIVVSDEKKVFSKDKEYVFITSPDNKVDKNCFLKIFSNGYERKGTPDNKTKKNCIFKTLPIHFSLFPLNDIHYPDLSITSKSAREGNSLDFVVTKQGEESLKEAQYTYAYEIFPETASQDDLKVESLTNSITFKPNETKEIISIKTIDDDIYEPNERISIKVYNSYGVIAKEGDAQIKESVDQSVILNDDPKAIVSVSNAETDEGGVLEFKVTRETGSSNLPFSINYTFSGGTATGADFNNTSGTIQFSDNIPKRIIKVKTIADAITEELETVKLTLQAANDIELKKATAIGTIKDVTVCWDSSEVTFPAKCPPVKVQPSSGPFSIKGNIVEGGEPLKFVISRSRPFDRPIVIQYKTHDGTAKSGVDYEPKVGMLEFQRNEPKKTLEVITKLTNHIADKTLLLKISSESEVRFSNNSALGVIERSCGTDAIDVQENVAAIKPNVEYIRKVKGYERVFETKGVIQPCGFAYVSVNGTYLQDIQTKNLVSARADINGKYQLTFAAASTEGTQERLIAIEEVALWRENNNDKRIQVGEHYDIASKNEPEILAIYSSQKPASDVTPNDLIEIVGNYIFAIIPSQDGCSFEYRYDPKSINADPYYKYTLRGVRRNNLCHIRAIGDSRFPNEEHVLFAAKDDKYSDIIFTPDSDGKFDVAVAFPDISNFYESGVYLSKNDYTGEAVKLNGSYVPVNSNNKPLPNGQAATLKKKQDEDQGNSIKQFFETLLNEMVRPYDNCDVELERQKGPTEESCLIRFAVDGDKWWAQNTFVLSGIKEHLEKRENRNLKYLTDRNTNDLNFALLVNSRRWTSGDEDYTMLVNRDTLTRSGQLTLGDSSLYQPEKKFTAVVQTKSGTKSVTETDEKSFTVKFKKPKFDKWVWIGRISLLGGLITMFVGFYKWLTELRFMKASGIFNKNRKKIFFAMANAYTSTSVLIANSVNAWSFSRDEIDYNEVWSVKEQSGKILDYVYSNGVEEDFIKKLKLSHPANPKVQSLP